MTSLMRSWSFTSHTHYCVPYIYHTYNDLAEKAGVLEERLRVIVSWGSWKRDFALRRRQNQGESLAEGVDDLSREVLVFHQAYTLLCPIHIPYVL